MDFSKLEQLKLRTEREWQNVKGKVEAVGRAAEQFDSDMTSLMQGVSQLGIEDLPFSSQEAREVKNELLQVVDRYNNLVLQLESNEGKGRAAVSHGMEAAESVVTIQELVAGLERESLTFEQSQILLETVFNAIQYLIAADETALFELLDLVGEKQVKKWLSQNG